MDGRQFDALTRALAAVPSRRTVLKTAIGTACGVLGLAGCRRLATA
jgi:hypothetical protein